MRVMEIVTLFGLGGAQSVVLNLSNSLAARGHAVSVVSSRGGATWALLDPRVRRVKLRSLKREISPLWDIVASLQILKAFRMARPDVVHLHSSKAATLARLVLFPYRRRLVYTVHGFDTILRANRRFLLLERILSRATGMIVAVSEYDKLNLLRERIRKVVRIYNGIDSRAPEAPSQLLRDLQRLAKPYAFVVMTIARMAAPKRFDLFVRVAAKLELESMLFVWIGGEADARGIPRNVLCCREEGDASGLLEIADLFLLLSDYEGLPILILEALRAGVPIVASCVGGIPEILNGTNGSVCQNVVEDIVRQITHYARNRAAHAAARKDARATLWAKFRLDSMVDQYEGLFRKLLPAGREM